MAYYGRDETKSPPLSGWIFRRYLAFSCIERINKDMIMSALHLFPMILAFLCDPDSEYFVIGFVL